VRAGSTPRLRRESAATGRVRRQPGGAGAGQPQSAREQGRSSLRDRGQRRCTARLRSSDKRSRGTSRGRSRGASRRSGLRHPPPPARAAGADPSGRTRCRGEEVAPPRWTGLPHPRRRARSRLVPILVGASTTRSRGGCLGRRRRGGPLGGDDEAGDNEAAWAGTTRQGQPSPTVPPSPPASRASTLPLPLLGPHGLLRLLVGAHLPVIARRGWGRLLEFLIFCSRACPSLLLHIHLFCRCAKGIC
jgi:hypothetical protein